VSPTYLYCIVDGDVLPAPGSVGLDGAPVRALPSGGMTVWVSDVASTPPPTVERIREHDVVCAAAVATGGTVIPTRFAHVFEDDASCLAALAQARPKLDAAREALRGAVEMAVILPLRGDAGAAKPVAGGGEGSAGRRYLEGIAERYRVERVVQTALSASAEALTAALGDLARSARRRVSTEPVPALIVSHLVARDAVPEYRARIARLAASGSLGAHVVTGPNAPYSFVDVGGGGGVA
jgi:gas vesicle protein GvpL/GvpF